MTAVDLFALTHHLAACPPLLRLDARALGGFEVDVGAVVRDVLYGLGDGAAYTRDINAIYARSEHNHLAALLVACWLLQAPALRAQVPAQRALAFFSSLGALSVLVPADKLVSDAERREELCRLALAAFAVLPSGESAKQAQDRLAALDSVERERVVRASREATARAKQVREALQKKAAEEAAAKVSRE